jgi:hypothetical protein
MKIHRYAAAAIALMLGVMGVNASFAADCPVDLSSLQDQVQTDSIRQSLSEPIDQKIINDGGLDAALAKAQDIAASLTTASSSTDEGAVTLADLRLVLPAYVEALQCRKNQ